MFHGSAWGYAEVFKAPKGWKYCFPCSHKKIIEPRKTAWPKCISTECILFSRTIWIFQNAVCYHWVLHCNRLGCICTLQIPDLTGMPFLPLLLLNIWLSLELFRLLSLLPCKDCWKSFFLPLNSYKYGFWLHKDPWRSDWTLCNWWSIHDTKELLNCSTQKSHNNALLHQRKYKICM